jgi:hypothetical protein
MCLFTVKKVITPATATGCPHTYETVPSGESWAAELHVSRCLLHSPDRLQRVVPLLTTAVQRLHGNKSKDITPWQKLVAVVHKLPLPPKITRVRLTENSKPLTVMAALTRSFPVMNEAQVLDIFTMLGVPQTPATACCPVSLQTLVPRGLGLLCPDTIGQLLICDDCDDPSLSAARRWHQPAQVLMLLDGPKPTSHC